MPSIGRIKAGTSIGPHAIFDRRTGHDDIGARALLSGLPHVDRLFGDRGSDADRLRETVADRWQVRQAATQTPRPSLA
ncbi:MAG: hypothetical protein AAGG57_00005 [Pseudomonadota bacterium]